MPYKYHKKYFKPFDCILCKDKCTSQTHYILMFKYSYYDEENGKQVLKITEAGLKKYNVKDN